jgi:cbb3-type cytochrome oxidase subunit 3
MSKKTIVILVIVILVILSIAGTAFYFLSNNKSSVNNNANLPLQQSTINKSGVQKVDLAKPPTNAIQSTQPIRKKRFAP